VKLEHKIVTKRAAWADNAPQGEIKLTTWKTQALIIVAVDGWNYKPYDCRQGRPVGSTWGVGGGKTLGMQVRMSMNGPLMLTMGEWKQINDYIDKVYQEVLDEHVLRGI
jgi:hypothetical protein